MILTDAYNNKITIKDSGKVILQLNFEKKKKHIGSIITKNNRTIFYKVIKHKLNKCFHSAIGFNAKVISTLKDDDYIGVCIPNKIYGNKWKIVTKKEFMTIAESVKFNEFEEQLMLEEYKLDELISNKGENK